MEERTKKTLEECKKLELKLSEAEKEKKNVDKKYTQVMVCNFCGNNLSSPSQTTITTTYVGCKKQEKSPEKSRQSA